MTLRITPTTVIVGGAYSLALMAGLLVLAILLIPALPILLIEYWLVEYNRAPQKGDSWNKYHPYDNDWSKDE